jgi:nitrogen fixation protein NifU and related proteins
MYSKETLERFKNPKFAGEMKNPDAIGEEGNLRCGDVMKIYLKVENNKIKNIKYQTYGCVAAISASEALCELAKGKTLDAAEKITAKDIADRLGNLPPIKFHCSVLGNTALIKAIKNYKEKGD